MDQKPICIAKDKHSPINDAEVVGWKTVPDRSSGDNRVTVNLEPEDCTLPFIQNEQTGSVLHSESNGRHEFAWSPSATTDRTEVLSVRSE